MNITEIYLKNIEKNGEDYQLGMAMEECAELIQAINKWKRNGKMITKMDNLLEEIADVEIMLDQLKLITNQAHLIEEIKQQKILRLKGKL